MQQDHINSLMQIQDQSITSLAPCQPTLSLEAPPCQLHVCPWSTVLSAKGLPEKC